METKRFGRIAAQAAKQVIIQGIREAERSIIYDEFTSKEHEILTGVVSRIEPRTGGVSIKISSNSEFTEAMLSASERIKGEELHEGDRIKVYVVEVRKSTRGPQVLISRTHPGLVKRLFELEVPEIFDGTVEIKSIAREAGSRTKMAVWSDDPAVDPIGACVGPRGGRVASIVEELGGEKIDIVKYSESPEEYIAAALAPAEVLSVTLLDEGKSCRVVVPGEPALAGHRQGGPERPPRRQADGLQDRHQVRRRGLSPAICKEARRRAEENTHAAVPWLPRDEAEAGAAARCALAGGRGRLRRARQAAGAGAPTCARTRTASKRR